MDFPEFKKNGPREKVDPVEVDAPEIDPDDDRPVEERRIDQQWRDLAGSGTPELHPLSLNRDSDHIK